MTGGGGSWGTEHVMSAHPQLAKQDVNEMVKYILSLSNSKTPKVMIPQSGSLKLKNHKQDEPQGVYALLATYTDKGANGIGPLTRTDTIYLRNAKAKPVYADAYNGFNRFGNNLTNGRNKSYLLFRNVDLTTINKFIYTYSAKDKEGEIEVRIDSQAGPIIAKDKFKATGDWNKTETLISPIAVPTTGRHDVYFYMIKWDKPNNDLMNLKEIVFSH
jgi:cytochrome c